MDRDDVAPSRPRPQWRSYSSHPCGTASSYKRNGRHLQATIIDTLDLPVPASQQLAQLLDGSITEAIQRLQSFRAEVVDYCSETEEDEAVSTEDDEGAYNTDPMVTDTENEGIPESCQEHRSRCKGATRLDGNFRAKRDAEMLQAFIQEAHTLLAAIRNDVHSHLPNLPTVQALQERFPSVAAVEPRAVLDSLSHSYQRANEVISRLSLCSASSFPEMPVIPVSLRFSTARASLSEYTGKRRFSLSNYKSLSLRSYGVSDDRSGLQPNPATNSSDLPSPPLSAMRAFLTNESNKLQARLPSRPPFEDWAGSLSHAIQDAKGYVQDEGEKIVDFVVDEAEKVSTALKQGASRLLQYHELPHEWKNNPVGLRNDDKTTELTHFNLHLVYPVWVPLHPHRQARRATPEWPVLA